MQEIPLKISFRPESGRPPNWAWRAEIGLETWAREFSGFDSSSRKVTARPTLIVVKMNLAQNSKLPPPHIKRKCKNLSKLKLTLAIVSASLFNIFTVIVIDSPEAIVPGGSLNELPKILSTSLEFSPPTDH